jgi:hypothetical protein
MSHRIAPAQTLCHLADTLEEPHPPAPPQKPTPSASVIPLPLGLHATTAATSLGIHFASRRTRAAVTAVALCAASSTVHVLLQDSIVHYASANVQTCRPAQ